MSVAEIEVFEGVMIQDFLNPIEGTNPSGQSVREDPVFAEIQGARAADDPSLPRGVWERDLKKADWQKVSDGCQNVLLTKSKDLQVAIWLMEAQMYINGVEGLARGLILLGALSDQFWDTVFPLMEDDDIEYRTNLFAWVNKRLSQPLRLTAISNPDNGDAYSWADWEKAQLENEHSKTAKGKSAGLLGKIKQSIDATDIAFYQNLWADLSDAESALDYLCGIVAEKFDEDAPSMAVMRDTLVLIRTMIEVQTDGRVMPNELEVNEDLLETEPTLPGDAKVASSPSEISDRQRAYMLLAEAADFIARDDPHSPVPYLVYKAIDWGRLGTSELYEEIFIRSGGSINIFELLGIDTKNDKKS